MGGCGELLYLLCIICINECNFNKSAQAPFKTCNNSNHSSFPTNPLCFAGLGDFFNFLFLNYFIETNSNLMREQFMEPANSVSGSSEINNKK